MNREDRRYFENRAKEERERAEEATSKRAKEAHATLAEDYEILARLKDGGEQ